MEYFNAKRKQLPFIRNPVNMFQPIKKNSLRVDNKFENYLQIPHFVNKENDHQIKQIMKKTRFSYQSIFFIQKIYEDEPPIPKLQIQKENYETEVILHEVEKKGFQFFQYSANNPIQDSICSFEITELKAFVISIYDGHGGPELSRFCAKNTSEYLKKYIKNSMTLHKYQNNKVQMIKDGLRQTHYQLENEYYKNYLKQITDNKKLKGVGTCAITVVIYQGKCIVATCGDSQAIMISQDRGSYNYQKLSERYSLSNKVQRQRLSSQFKDIDKNVIVEQRKNVFYLKGMLQPTKSIGDYYLKHKQHYIGQDQFKGPYLSCQPQIKVHEIKEHDKHIVIASDGLWDFLSKWQILKHIVQSKNKKTNISQRQTESQNQDQVSARPMTSPEYLTQKILEKASNDLEQDINYLKSLQLGERRSYHDDVTIAIIDIKQFQENQNQKN